ncbi:hypothetical protein TNCV_3201481 [Trichonephila clavipes]|nr:hypothetical protein TNCV_3201481 [Trichonephila clavipes]
MKLQKRGSGDQYSEQKRHANGATSVAVYCGQMPSQRRPIRPPLKVDHRRHRYSGTERSKTGQLISGVVSSLRMRVGSVPEGILNAF